LTRLERRDAPAVINFAINAASSNLTFSGSLGGAAIVQQGAGSLTQSFAGNVRADVDFAGNTLQFLADGTTAVANSHGPWAPGIGGGPGTALANFAGRVPVNIGFTVNVNLAVRGAVSTLESAVLALSGAGATRTFSSTQTFTLLAGTVDYRDALLGTLANGTGDISGSTTTNASTTAGTFADLGGGQYSITAPIEASLATTVTGPSGPLPATYTLKGSLSATATLPVVDLNGAATGFDVSFSTPGTPPALIAPLATITRATAADLTSLTVTLVSPPDGTSEALAVDLTGLGLSTTGYDPVSGKLVITGPASLATYQAALRKVVYSNAAASPTAGPRAITVVVNDGGNDSLPRTATATITIPPAVVQSVVVNDGAAQRSMVRSVTVTFDRVVTANGSPASFLSLTGPGGPVGLVVDTTGSTPANTVYRLTFTGAGITGGSLANGRYTLTIPADNGTAGVINFDGDANGVAGGNFELVGDPATNKLFRLYGDNDGDGTVGASDFLAFRLAFLSNSPTFDLDGDGSVGASEFLTFRLGFLQPV
jgi:hypothetical protein